MQGAPAREPVFARLAIVAAHLGFPLGNGLTPLVFFWQPGKRHRAVREHCASAFDFQMTYVCSLLLAFIALLKSNHSMIIDGGYGKLKGKTFRISNMGDESEASMTTVIKGGTLVTADRTYQADILVEAFGVGWM